MERTVGGVANHRARQSDFIAEFYGSDLISNSGIHVFL
jgi:hypothetical protein